MTVGWRSAEKTRDRKLLQTFTCAAPKDPKYRTEVQRFFRAKAIAFVNGGTKVDDRHLLLLFDDDVLAGAVVHSFVPTLDALGGVSARVVDYIGVALDYQGKTGKILTNGARASTALLSLALGHIADRSTQPDVIAAAIHVANAASQGLLAKFGVNHTEPPTGDYRAHWGAWDSGPWTGTLPTPLP